MNTKDALGKQNKQLVRKQRRKRGEHRFLYNETTQCLPRCVTCGCDEDDVFVGGHECTYGQSEKQLDAIREENRRDEKRGLYPDKIDIAN